MFEENIEDILYNEHMLFESWTESFLLAEPIWDGHDRPPPLLH